jgi:hypothetical protein
LQLLVPPVQLLLLLLLLKHLLSCLWHCCVYCELLCMVVQWLLVLLLDVTWKMMVCHRVLQLQLQLQRTMVICLECRSWHRSCFQCS